MICKAKTANYYKNVNAVVIC